MRQLGRQICKIIEVLASKDESEDRDALKRASSTLAETCTTTNELLSFCLFSSSFFFFFKGGERGVPGESPKRRWAFSWERKRKKKKCKNSRSSAAATSSSSLFHPHSLSMQSIVSLNSHYPVQQVAVKGDIKVQMLA